MTTHRPSPRADAPPPGLRVGDYELLTRIGEGGMGVVHLARKPGGPRVALKVLRPNVVGDDEARHRLAREVSSLSRVRSPRIAEIVDADPWGDIPYVATRYVPGLSLHDHVKEEGPIEDEDLRWFAHCLAEALAAVHEVGVLHRDIKPSNVLMEGRSPILIDFGLARLADDPRLTHTGYLLGTPGYLAPEILFGEEATPAADVHSWAATVAYAGTGRSPFGRGPAMAIMDRVRRGEHDLTGLTGDLERIVHACLDPEPARRPDLDLVLRWLEPAPPVSAAAEPELFTAPYAVAAFARADDSTHVAAPDRTDVLPEPGPTQAEADTEAAEADDDWIFADDWREQPGATLVEGRDDAPTSYLESQPRIQETSPYQEPPPPRRADPWPVRLRRSALVGLAALTAGAATAAYPYLAIGLFVCFGWVLRSVSLAGTAAGDLRRLRGPKWYDGPRALLASPWHFLRSVPGTVMLLCWAAGLALASGLVSFALGLGLTEALLVNGTVFAVAMWIGPGGGRIRRPVRRVVDPIAASLTAWAVTLVLVGGAGAVLGYLAVSGGPDWAPAYSEPFLPGTFLGDLVRR